MAVCVYCTKEYVAEKPQSKYCSENCKSEVKKQRKKNKRVSDRENLYNKPIECQFCGTTFLPEGKRNISALKYCSDKCKSDMNYFGCKKSEIVVKKKTCLTCGKSFLPKHHQEGYCSDLCRSDGKKCRERETRRKKIIKQEIFCEYCGKSFIPGGFHNLYKIKYCSTTCRDNFNYYKGKKPPEKRIFNVPAERKCVVCDVAFTPPHASPNAITCSKRCGIKRQHDIDKEIRTAIREKNVERILSLTKRHNKISKSIIDCLVRDSFKCVVCERDTNVVVHHLNGQGEKYRGKKNDSDNRLENLITLCNECHSNIHNVFLLKIDGGWVVESDIFKKLGLSGYIKIK